MALSRFEQVLKDMRRKDLGAWKSPIPPRPVGLRRLKWPLPCREHFRFICLVANWIDIPTIAEFERVRAHRDWTVAIDPAEPSYDYVRPPVLPKREPAQVQSPKRWDWATVLKTDSMVMVDRQAPWRWVPWWINDVFIQARLDLSGAAFAAWVRRTMDAPLSSKKPMTRPEARMAAAGRAADEEDLVEPKDSAQPELDVAAYQEWIRGGRYTPRQVGTSWLGYVPADSAIESDIQSLVGRFRLADGEARALIHHLAGTSRQLIATEMGVGQETVKT